MQEKVKNHYASENEGERLFRDNAHRTEYLTTIRYFDNLFKPNSKILDACAATGVYSFYLADKGHNVTACDLSEHHVGIMKSSPNAEKLDDIRACNIMDLSEFEDNSFDVVLCMGALYHLPKNEDMQKAISECARVCKPGGIVAFAYLTRIGCFYRELSDDARNINDLLTYKSGSLAGLFVAVTPAEIEDLATKHGIYKTHTIATDGMIYAVADKLNRASDDDFQKYMEFHYSICEAPDVVGATLHGLWIGRKS